MSRGTFLDLEPVNLREADIIMVPVPYEATTTYGGGHPFRSRGHPDGQSAGGTLG